MFINFDVFITPTLTLPNKFTQKFPGRRWCLLRHEKSQSGPNNLLFAQNNIYIWILKLEFTERGLTKRH
jgi:hypothetical protein